MCVCMHCQSTRPPMDGFPHAAAPPLAIYFCTNNGWAPYPACEQSMKAAVELDKKQQLKLEEHLKQNVEALRTSHEENEELRQEIEKLRADAKMSISTEVAELSDQVRRQQQVYKEMETRILEMVERLHTKHAIIDPACYPDKEQQHQLEEDLKQKEKALRRSQEENEELRQEIQKLRAEASSLSQPHAEMSTSTEVVELREQVKEMESRMEKAERLHNRHVMEETALYRNDSATPMLLQAAVGAVKDATAMCARNLFPYTKQHSMPGPGAVRGCKMAPLEAFLCNLFFQDFESPDSFIPCSNTSRPSFVRPELLRRQRFQAYKSFSDVEPVDIIGGLQHADPICSAELKLFLESKLDCLARQLIELVKISEEEADVQLIIKDANKPLYTSFLRLARAVWLLHKLAFAFEPASAEILRVAQGSTFVAEYMENMVPDQLEDDHEEQSSEQVVGFMSVPGFTVRNSIIKARVYLA